MRHLMIMRHGKAERGEGKPDFERQMEPRGWEEAERVARTLAEHQLVPDTVLCSTARRTRDTLAACLPHIAKDCTVHLMASLYDAETNELREALRRAEGQNVLLIGHNPSVHSVSMLFAGQDADRIGPSYPTSTTAVFSMGFAVDSVRFERLVSP